MVSPREKDVYARGRDFSKPVADCSIPGKGGVVCEVVERGRQIAGEDLKFKRI